MIPNMLDLAIKELVKRFHAELNEIVRSAYTQGRRDVEIDIADRTEAMYKVMQERKKEE